MPSRMASESGPGAGDIDVATRRITDREGAYERFRGDVAVDPGAPPGERRRYRLIRAAFSMDPALAVALNALDDFELRDLADHLQQFRSATFTRHYPQVLELVDLPARGRAANDRR